MHIARMHEILAIALKDTLYNASKSVIKIMSTEE